MLSRYLWSATAAVLCSMAECSQVRADVVGGGDPEVGVERQGLLPVLAGQAPLGCRVAGLSEAGGGGGLLGPGTRLHGPRGRGGGPGAPPPRFPPARPPFPPPGCAPRPPPP